MNVLAAILILGASGTATRTVVVEDSLPAIVGRVVIGGMKDVLHSESDRSGLRMPDVSLPSLRIDGEPRAGWAWGAAAYRVVGYMRDRQSGGSVEYEYRLRVRGFDVRRKTTIADGHVVLTTDVYGRIGPRGELYHVRLAIDAREYGLATHICGTATGYSHIGDRCRLVARAAHNRISDAMARELLATIERGGRAWYSAGSVAEVLR